MFAQIKERTLVQRGALITAIVGFWLLAGLGAYWNIASICGAIFFVPKSPANIVAAQVGLIYLGLAGAKLPAIWFVAFIISRSNFRRPMLIAGAVTFVSELVRFEIQLIRWPWPSWMQMEWWVPVGLDLLSVMLLTLGVIGMAWIFQKWNKATPTLAAARA